MECERSLWVEVGHLCVLSERKLAGQYSQESKRGCLLKHRAPLSFPLFAGANHRGPIFESNVSIVIHALSIRHEDAFRRHLHDQLRVRLGERPILPRFFTDPLYVSFSDVQL